MNDEFIHGAWQIEPSALKMGSALAGGHPPSLRYGATCLMRAQVGSYPGKSGQIRPKKIKIMGCGTFERERIMENENSQNEPNLKTQESPDFMRVKRRFLGLKNEANQPNLKPKKANLNPIKPNFEGYKPIAKPISAPNSAIPAGARIAGQESVLAPTRFYIAQRTITWEIVRLIYN